MNKKAINAAFGVDDDPQDAATTSVQSPGDGHKSAAERAAEIRERRAGGVYQRVLGGFTRKLEVYGEVPGYHLHIANDDGNRIAECQRHGFEFVLHDEIKGVNGNVTSFNTDLGSKVRFLVGTRRDGEPMYGYLMKLPIEIWEEDEQLRNDRAMAPINQMRSGRLPSHDKLTKDDVEDMAGGNGRQPVTVDISSSYSRGVNPNGS